MTTYVVEVLRLSRIKVEAKDAKEAEARVAALPSEKLDADVIAKSFTVQIDKFN